MLPETGDNQLHDTSYPGSLKLVLLTQDWDLRAEAGHTEVGCKPSSSNSFSSPLTNSELINLNTTHGTLPTFLLCGCCLRNLPQTRILSVLFLSASPLHLVFLFTGGCAHTHTECRVLSSFVVLHDSKYNNGFLLTESNLYGWVAVSLICAFGRTSRGPYWQPSTQVLMFTWLGCQHVFLFGSVWVFFCNEISISIFFIGLFELEKCRNPPSGAV